MEGLLDFGSLAIQAVNLAVVAYVLKRFVFSPYLAYLDEEQAKRDEIERSHEVVREAEESARKKAAGIVEEAKREGKNIREESKTLAKQEASLIVFEANKEAEAVRAKGLADIGNERRALEESLRAKVVSVALKINEKVFGKSEANADLVKSLAKDL
ncbi:MAG: synthase subunit b [Patescibacteria group bacterium]|nr:synthase subunit b [Patescibacteria group bacterium]